MRNRIGLGLISVVILVGAGFWAHAQGQQPNGPRVLPSPVSRRRSGRRARTRRSSRAATSGFAWIGGKAIRPSADGWSEATASGSSRDDDGRHQATDTSALRPKSRGWCLNAAMRRRVMRLMVAFCLAACGPKKVVVDPAIAGRATLAQADANLRAGCFDCLVEALKQYESVRAIPVPSRRSRRRAPSAPRRCSRCASENWARPIAAIWRRRGS